MSLDLNQFVTLLVSGALCVVVFLAIVSNILHRRAERRIVNTRMTCRICGSLFQSEHPPKVLACPHCAEWNLSRRNGKLG